MRFHKNCSLIVVALAMLALVAPVHADKITHTYGTSTPQAAWDYFKLSSAGRRHSTSYIPLRVQYPDVAFQGFVMTPDNGEWGGPDFGSNDTIYVFRTMVLADGDMTIALNEEGDDGHSVYVNGEFMGGGGFGASINFDLVLKAGVPVELELALYNAGGPLSLVLVRQDDGLPLTSTSGVTVTAPTLLVSPPGWLFPLQLVNSSSANKNFTLTNFGADPFDIVDVSVTGADSTQFSAVSTCPTPLSPGSHCEVKTSFQPTSINTHSAVLAISDRFGGLRTASLGGVGTVISTAPTSIDFGNQTVGTSSDPVLVTLTNTGSDEVKISDITIRDHQNSADFAHTSDCASSLAGGASCTISVTFSPQSIGARDGRMYITDNGGSPQVVSLSGTGD